MFYFRVKMLIYLFYSQMDSELSPTTRPKARYTGKIRLCIARYR